jgi:5-methylcytosine-specific restriction endonuclease McrA
MKRGPSAARIPCASFATAVLVVNAFRCAYCGEPAAETEFFVPRTAGGSDDAGNRTAACRLCNDAKGAVRLKPDVERRMLSEAQAKADQVENVLQVIKAAESAARGRRTRALLVDAEADNP